MDEMVSPSTAGQKMDRYKLMRARIAEIWVEENLPATEAERQRWMTAFIRFQVVVVDDCMLWTAVSTIFTLNDVDAGSISEVG